MKKLLAAAMTLPFVATQAAAGGMAEPIVEQEIEQQTAAGSRAGILVPILALILIGLAMSNDSDAAEAPLE
ncbi:MAG: hypothetical protein N2Z62_06890 [Rhodobacteraceae bacterium]|nr:hypothetical protein [Paracoccaceae bacterium]